MLLIREDRATEANRLWTKEAFIWYDYVYVFVIKNNFDSEKAPTSDITYHRLVTFGGFHDSDGRKQANRDECESGDSRRRQNPEGQPG